MTLAFIVLGLFCFFAVVRWAMTSQDANHFRRLTADLESEVAHLQRRIRHFEMPEHEPDDEEMALLKVGSPVEIVVGGFRIRGKMESIASPSPHQDSCLGFCFRADGDPNTMWIDPDYGQVYVLDDSDTEHHNEHVVAQLEKVRERLSEEEEIEWNYGTLLNLQTSSWRS